MFWMKLVSVFIDICITSWINFPLIPAWGNIIDCCFISTFDKWCGMLSNNNYSLLDHICFCFNIELSKIFRGIKNKYKKPGHKSLYQRWKRSVVNFFEMYMYACLWWNRLLPVPFMVMLSYCNQAFIQ